LLEKSRNHRAEKERKRQEAATDANTIVDDELKQDVSETVDFDFSTETRKRDEEIQEVPAQQSNIRHKTAQHAEPIIPEPRILENVTYQKPQAEPNICPESSLQIRLSEYKTYEGLPLQDPRNAKVLEIEEGLCSIIGVEGPVLTKRAYDVYLRCCGIKRMGRELEDLKWHLT
jgi:hypothetical protein